MRLKSVEEEAVDCRKRCSRIKLEPLEVKMCEHRYRCFVCEESQALDPEEPCESCQEAEEELEQYILSQHDAEIAWEELTAAERNQVHLRETN